MNRKLYQKCTECGRTSIPGLIKGQGKCQYHWNVGTFGQKWADEIFELEAREAYFNYLNVDQHEYFARHGI